MSRNIIIVGSCQVGGIGAAIKCIFPQDNIRVIGFQWAEKQISELSLMKDCDCLIYEDHPLSTYTPPPNLSEYNDKILVVKYPNIYFPAFHPDIVYVNNEGKIFECSAISIWCFMNNISIDHCVKLYNDETFSKLGYFGLWEKSIIQLKKRFDDCGFDFNKFILNVKRDGVFMHTLNHPKIKTLVQLGKLLAQKIGADDKIFNIEYNIPDALDTCSWAVYPAIGSSLCLPHSYSWNLGGVHLYGLSNFVEWSYKHYEINKFDSKVQITQSDLINILNLVLPQELNKLK